MADVFKFRLDIVLDLRRRAEKECAQRLAAVQREMNACTKMMAELEQEVRDLTQARRQARSESRAEARLFLDADHYEIRLRRLISDLSQKQSEIVTRLDARRRELVKASQSAKALERLKERRRQQYEESVSRKESAALDEIGQIIHQRRDSLLRL